jgi:phosphate transport system substrate-binding protein
LKSPRLITAAALSAVLAFGVAACGSDSSSTSSDSSTGDSSVATGLSGEVAGAGSSAQEAAQEAWIVGVQDGSPDATINYDPIGSGGGREQFIAGAVQYAGSDSALEGSELKGAIDNCGDADLVQVPVYVSPIAVIYNLPDVTDLQLDPETLANIMNQKITTWNDPAIAALNPDATLPDTAITPVNRSDDSGTTANFTDYLSQTAPSAWPYPADDTWPVDGGEAAEGTSGVVDAVKSADGGIGYADESQAGDLGIASIKVGDEYVAPSAEGAAADLDISKFENPEQYVFDFAINRTTTDPSTYPITLASYAIACTSSDDQALTGIVAALFQYAVSPKGQDAAAGNAGSAPITDQLRSKIQPAVDAIGS